MKQTVRFLLVAAVAVSINVLVSTTFAETAHLGSAGSHNSSQVVRYHGGGYHGGGYYGGHYGGGWGWGWGWGGWYPYWGLSYAYAPWPYYYNGYYYNGYYYPPTAYYPPPAVYSSQATVDDNSPPPAPATESPQQPSVDRPLSPTAVDRDSDSPPPPPPPRAQRPPQPQRNDRGPSPGVADVKALAEAGLSDDVILSHIRNSQAVYHLTTAEIIDLKKSGVSEKVIDFMINTASAPR
ncbi:MAG: hypothetical protein ACLP0A_18325 [Verrucomicrobiia bacterium]